MWLWRGETGLWEPDPATPLNFRGNLLGVAFDPNNPSRGYAVGQQGVLLRFGKTWTQEALPSEVAGASFTSIAFAGSEAIVAFRVAHVGNGEAAPLHGRRDRQRRLRLACRSGSCASARGRGAVGGRGPARRRGRDLGHVRCGFRDRPRSSSARGLERLGRRRRPTRGSTHLARWHCSAKTGRFALSGSGGLPQGTLQNDTERAPPAGFPPTLIAPYKLATGYVVRQTSSGWSDQEHERNAARDPLGEYKHYDTVFQPDPTLGGADRSYRRTGLGGGRFRRRSQLRARHGRRRPLPADGVPPPGLATAPIQASPTQATFAIGGNAGCLAPCADRANAGLGPDRWLTTALSQAAQISGVRAFFYTGPRVTSGEGHGGFPVPYEREFARYATVLDGPLPTYAAASSTDLGPGSECPFQEAFGSFPAPFGSAPPAPELAQAGRSSEACSSYYSINSTGSSGTVRVIVLDESHDVDSEQLAWLSTQLGEARQAQTPAIVVGSTDLNAQIAGGDGAAAEVARTIVDGEASAYFYNSPEQNITLPLRVGSQSIPTFGSGTLGYVSAVEAQRREFIGHSGFLLAQVEVSARGSTGLPPNEAPVSARLIPNIGELALEAKSGVLLRRSQTAQFEALARRPRSGGEAARDATHQRIGALRADTGQLRRTALRERDLARIRIPLVATGNRQLRRAEPRGG